MKKLSLYLMGIFYIVAGVAHFTSTEMYLLIMPPYIPMQLELVYLSGVIEIALGFGLFVPKWKRWAAYGIIALLIAIFPANIYMAQTGGSTVGSEEWLPLLSWARLPIQFLLIWWAYSHRSD